MDSILGLVGLDRQPEAPGYAADYSSNNYNNVKEEEGGLANQILAFIGIKGNLTMSWASSPPNTPISRLD